MLREQRMAFGVEANVGLKRLNDEQIVGATECDRLRLHRGAKRAIEKLSAADFSALSDASKKRHVVASAQFGVLAMFAHKSSTKRIEAAAQKADSLPIGETLRLFSE